MDSPISATNDAKNNVPATNRGAIKMMLAQQ
jgi:hypothetical protein